MDDQEECFVSGALAGILCFTRFVGMAPLRFVRYKNGWRVGISSILTRLTCVLTTIFYITGCWALIIDFQDDKVVFSNTFFYQLVWTAELVVTKLKAAPLLYISSEHMQTMITCVNQMKKINTMLKIRKCPPPWNKLQIGIIIIWMTFSTVMIVSDYMFLAILMRSFNKSMTIIAVYSTYYFYQWMTQLAIIQFATIVLYTRTSFKVVNESFGHLLLDTSNAKDSRPTTKTVRILCSAYGTACDMVRDVNRSYGLTVMILLAGTFLNLVVKPYYVIEIIEHTDNNELNNLSKFGPSIYWSICHFANLVMMVEPCKLTHDEIDMTRHMVSRLLLRTRSSNDPQAIEIEQFCRSHTLPQVAYKPMNIVKMSRGFILTILSSLSTYLVILVNIK